MKRSLYVNSKLNFFRTFIALSLIYLFLHFSWKCKVKITIRYNYTSITMTKKQYSKTKQNPQNREFPGDPVAATLCSDCQGPEFNLCFRN